MNVLIDISNYDLIMKELNNGKERDAEEWAALFQVADPGFKFRRIKYPEGAKLAVIEAVWEGASDAETGLHGYGA